MNKRSSYCAGLICVLLLAAGCAPSTDAMSAASGGAAGFFQGFWHGFIVLFTFVGSLFVDDMGIYEAHNNGHLYNLGFLLGVMVFFGGSGGGACKKAC